MNFSPKYLIKVLEDHGFTFKRSKGSHQLFYNPTSKKTVVVPIHAGQDLPKGTFYAILKQAGIDRDKL